MHPAAAYVLPSWEGAFRSSRDTGPTLVAGKALWVRVTHVVYNKRFLRSELRPECVSEAQAEGAYYFVTAAGLHVGQDAPESVTAAEPDFSTPEEGTRLDFFVPRERITSVARWEVGTGGVMAKVHLGSEGACVDICFVDPTRQFSGNTEGELAATVQRENVIRALVDGVAPVIETATKVCPDCAERVKYLANVCRFCGYRFDGSSPPRGSLLRTLAARLADRIAEPPRPGDVSEPHGRGDLDEDLREQEAQNGRHL